MVAVAGQTAALLPSQYQLAHCNRRSELNGNATSTIELVDTYNDLGARIVAPESDFNLGIVIVCSMA